jgi:hypothetical protein
MVSSRDSHIIELWLQRQASAHTRGCYRRDVARLLAQVPKPLTRLTLGDLQSFAQSLCSGRPGSHLAGSHAGGGQGLFGFCQRMRYLTASPAAELSLPCYEKRLAERIVSEEDVLPAGGSGRKTARSGSYYGCFMPTDSRRGGVYCGFVPASFAIWPALDLEKMGGQTAWVTDVLVVISGRPLWLDSLLPLRASGYSIRR